MATDVVVVIVVAAAVATEVVLEVEVPDPKLRGKRRRFARSGCFMRNGN